MMYGEFRIDKVQMQERTDEGIHQETGDEEKEVRDNDAWIVDQ